MLIDAEFSINYNLITEGTQDSQETPRFRSRLEKLEDEVKHLKSVACQISEDVEELKKANKTMNK